MNKPNIIFILLDDFGWKDLSCYGSDFYETPHLDKLCTESMKFTDAYAACPVCSPTRASIMAGKYPARIGLTNFIAGSARGKLLEQPYTKYLPHDEKSLASSLRENGYRTWHVGKWHLGSRDYYPDRHGFDVNIAGCHKGHPNDGYFSPWNIETLENGPEGEYLTDRLTDEAIALLEGESEKPFFLNLWYYTVHTPIQAKEEVVEKYRRKAKEMGLDKLQEFAEGDFFPSEHKRDMRIQRRLIQSDPAYAAMIEIMDVNIGRLLEALEKSGQAENTLIVFTSDNGGLATAEGSPTCNAPLAEGKGWMYEGGTREPLLIKWPGVVEKGSVCKEVVTSTDFYPTLLEAAGIPLMPEQHVDGANLMPLLKQSGKLDREAVYWHYPHYGNQGCTPGCSMRMGDFKLIEFFEDERFELYNLNEDLSEECNLAEKMPDLLDKMKTMLDAWKTDVDAVIPIPNPDFVPWRDADCRK